MVPRALRINSALQLDGAKVCVQSGTTTIDNLADFFSSNGMTLQEVVSASTDESIKNYDAGLCSVLTSDLSQLYALRLRLAKPRDQVILPDVISKEPLGPVVRDNDLQWISVVRWVYFAMINAEELGVSSRTIDQALRSQKPEVKRLVGTSGDFGEQIGLTNAWAANVIRYVGNYGEVFERNLGATTPLAIPGVSINCGAKAAFNMPRQFDDGWRQRKPWSRERARTLWLDEHSANYGLQNFIISGETVLHRMVRERPRATCAEDGLFRNLGREFEGRRFFLIFSA